MADVFFNETVDNTDFEEVINAYEADVNPETEHDFISMLGTAKFVAPVQVLGVELAETEDGRLFTDLEEGVQVNYQVIQNGKGDIFFPAFTSQAEYDKWSTDVEGIVTSLLSIEQYMALISSNPEVTGVVINAFGQNIVMNQDNLEYVMATLTQMREQDPITLEDATDDQTDFAARMVEVFPGNVPDIRTVWAIDLVRQPERSLIYVIDADGDIDDAKAQFFAFAQVEPSAPAFNNVLGVAEIGYPRVATFAPVYNRD
jgi:hypothetical protein